MMSENEHPPKENEEKKETPGENGPVPEPDASGKPNGQPSRINRSFILIGSLAGNLIERWNMCRLCCRT